MTWDQVLTWLVMPAVVAIILGGGGLWRRTMRAHGDTFYSSGAFGDWPDNSRSEYDNGRHRLICNRCA
jgi:hypothetical protein